MTMTDITLTCDTCGKEFQKKRGEYNRRKRLRKTEFFCSISCAAKRPANLEHIEKHRSDYDISQHSKNKYDEYSDFRYYLKMVNAKNRKENIDIDLPFLKQLWESQNGICKISGIKMALRTHSNAYKGTKNYTELSPYTASLDRIDSNKPYQQGNIRWICFIANMAKHTFSDDELIEFCKTVAQQHS